MTTLTHKNIAPKRYIYESKDSNQHANNLQKWSQEYDQFSHGEFYGCIEELNFSQIRIFKEHTNQAVHQHCNIEDNGLWLGLSASQQHFKINGLTSDNNDILCQTQHQDFELMTPKDFTIFGLVIAPQVIEKLISDNAESPRHTLFTPSKLHTQTGNEQYQLRYLMARLLAMPEANINANVQQKILLDGVINLFTNTKETTPYAISYARRKKVVELVQQYMQAYPNSVFTLHELCELTHVSQRTLQYSFDSILGISPHQFIKITRLNQIRRMLIQHDPSGHISDIIFNFGFYHLGQFSKDYTSLFGENPSKTLARPQG